MDYFPPMFDQMLHAERGLGLLKAQMPERFFHDKADVIREKKPKRLPSKSACLSFLKRIPCLFAVFSSVFIRNIHLRLTYSSKNYTTLIEINKVLILFIDLCFSKQAA